MTFYVPRHFRHDDRESLEAFVADGGPVGRLHGADDAPHRGFEIEAEVHAELAALMRALAVRPGESR